MRLHFLGICGTFMCGLAKLATDLGYQVSGQDSNFYPPMSLELQRLGIAVGNSYAAELLPDEIDCLVIGNVMRRGMPIIEQALNQGIKMLSGPEFLAKFVLPGKHVLAVTGTHGKTTTSCMLAWILTAAGLQPGYLIGGVAKNFDYSAALGGGEFFVIEGDEYDCAFFDKGAKFLHYQPQTLIINNLEYDHSDIFADLAAIKQQFHYLVRMIPGSGKIIYAGADANIVSMLNLGCWTPTETFGLATGDWNLTNTRVPQNPQSLPAIAQYNQLNAIAAVAAANNVGVSVAAAESALTSFAGVKRRLEITGSWQGATIIEDFAHHPTAIKLTMQTVAKQWQRIIAIVEFAANSMRTGVHQTALQDSSIFAAAQRVYYYSQEPLSWPIEQAWQALDKPGGVFYELDALQRALAAVCNSGDCLLLMGNGALAGAFHRLIKVKDCV